jgi:hypothetical protein
MTARQADRILIAVSRNQYAEPIIPRGVKRTSSQLVWFDEYLVYI